MSKIERRRDRSHTKDLCWLDFLESTSNFS